MHTPCGDGATKSSTATLFPNEAAAGGIKQSHTRSIQEERKERRHKSSLVSDQEGGEAGGRKGGREEGREVGREEPGEKVVSQARPTSAKEGRVW